MNDLNPRLDIVFKKIFGVEEHQHLTIKLLNSILNADDQIESITLLNPYNAQEFKNDKLSILDIKARCHSGRLFSIEMQISDEADYNKRALYYWAKMYTNQLRKGDRYTDLNKAIGIHILNFTSIPGVEDYHNIYNLRNQNNEQYFDDIELHTIELSKFTDSLGQIDDAQLLLKRVKKGLDLWSAFLTRHDLLAKVTDKLDLDISAALHILEVMSFTEEERETYESRLGWYRFEASALDKAMEQGIEQGKAEGLVEGKAEGLVEGKAKGKAEGKAELIQAMYNNGMDISAISKAINVSVRVIKQLIH